MSKFYTYTMGICPYCESEIHLSDFFSEHENKKKFLGLKTYNRNFQGESYNINLGNAVKMYTCPRCNKILGFSEYYWER